ncbi:hypothetical protein ACFQ9X_48320 [Catenulispora yoronensis]
MLIAGVALALWHYPTGLVVFWLAIACVAVLVLVEFFAEAPRTKTTRPSESR